MPFSNGWKLAGLRSFNGDYAEVNHGKVNPTFRKGKYGDGARVTDSDIEDARAIIVYHPDVGWRTIHEARTIDDVEYAIEDNDSY